VLRAATLREERRVGGVWTLLGVKGGVNVVGVWPSAFTRRVMEMLIMICSRGYIWYGFSRDEWMWTKRRLQERRNTS